MTALVIALTVLVGLQLIAMVGYGAYRLGKRSTPESEPPPVVVEAAPTEPVSWLQGLLLETIIVHTGAGLSYEGLLVLTEDKGLMLRNPKLLDDKRSPIPMAGELWIYREKVEGVQTKPAELDSLPEAS